VVSLINMAAFARRASQSSEPNVQVNLFITRRAGRMKNKLLVLPVAPDAVVPKAYQNGWIHFGTFESDDAMFTGVDLELHLQIKGYVVMDAEAQDATFRLKR
ncbi:MAG TPA: hypothetical protein VGB81_15930, partial [Devosia sp.]